eukprot:UC4_evm1s1406
MWTLILRIRASLPPSGHSEVTEFFECCEPSSISTRRLLVTKRPIISEHPSESPSLLHAGNEFRVFEYLARSSPFN